MRAKGWVSGSLCGRKVATLTMSVPDELDIRYASSLSTNTRNDSACWILAMAAPNDAV